MTEATEMPRYQCHKKVWALKIAGVEIHKDGSATIAPADEGYDPFVVKSAWSLKFQGDEDDLGYFVVYEDGYQSWSPTRAFESGYTRES